MVGHARRHTPWLVGDACAVFEAGKKGSVRGVLGVESGLGTFFDAHLLALPVTEAVCCMVIDHTRCLHMRVDDRAANEPESTFLEIFRQNVGFG